MVLLKVFHIVNTRLCRHVELDLDIQKIISFYPLTHVATLLLHINNKIISLHICRHSTSFRSTVLVINDHMSFLSPNYDSSSNSAPRN